MKTTVIIIASGILLLLITLFILFGFLAIQRLRTTKRRRQIDNYISSKEEDWYAYLIEGTLDVTKLAPSNEIEREAASEILYRYRKSFNSKKIHFQIFKYAERYLASYYKAGLNDPKWSIRMNTLHRISFFNLHFLADDVQKLAISKRSLSKEEWLYIYNIMAMTNRSEFASYFISPAVPFGEFDYRRLLSALNEEQHDILVRHFVDLPTVLQYVIVDVIGSKHYLGFLPLLERCLTSDDAELRIRTLKTFAKIDDFPISSVTATFVESSIWEERLMAAKVYANAPADIARNTLSILLEDPVYEVRKQAAHSLHMIRTGDERLKTFIQQSDDLYAIEMAAEMIGKE